MSCLKETLSRKCVNGAAVHQSGGVWVIKPGEGAKKVTISVTAELDGKMQPMGSKEYRVKALPDPQAYFSARDKEYSSGNIAPSTLTHSTGTVTASYGPDGLLDLPFKVTSFRAIINGMTTQSQGNKFTKDQIAQIGKLKTFQSPDPAQQTFRACRRNHHHSAHNQADRQ